MEKFRLTASVTISVYTEVEAETLEEAKAIAEGRELCSITNTSGDTADVAWMCDELDGTPMDIDEC